MADSLAHSRTLEVYTTRGGNMQQQAPGVTTARLMEEVYPQIQQGTAQLSISGVSALSCGIRKYCDGIEAAY